ncbi:MAG: hypothetical protein JXA92_10010 [candidate division Zixibacteria bacterium]|nr:hypothetical protein [candidate division Zixibacteria bacterium]
MKITPLIIFVFGLLVGVRVYAQTGKHDEKYTGDTTSTEPPRYIIRIDRLEIDNMKLRDTLLITVETFGCTVAGFDLKFGTASPFISIESVLPGEINDSCDWEYFKAVPVTVPGDDMNYPSELWQAVALAKITPDTTKPVCFGFERKASLLKLVVSNDHVLQTPDTTAPIFFFWEDCSDNSLSDATGGSMIISNKVFDYFGSEMSDNRQLFPTRRGAPRQCISPNALNKPLRLIDFHNGGILFRLDLGEEIPEEAADTTVPDSVPAGIDTN